MNRGRCLLTHSKPDSRVHRGSWLSILALVVMHLSTPVEGREPQAIPHDLAEPIPIVPMGPITGSWQQGPDAAVWAQGLALGELRQVDPLEGARASARTEIRLLRDQDALYILARMNDTEPQRIIAREMARGASIDGDDLLRIVIDPHGRGREGYLFEVNALANRREALLEGDQIANFDWDGRWEAHAAIDEQGWWAAVRIPFRTLSFDSDNDTWGFNFERNQRRLQERSRWTNIRRSQWVAAVSQTAPMAGFSGSRSGIGLSITPNTRIASDRGPRSRGVEPIEVGVDAVYQLTRNLKLSATINTDFAEAEIDAREVNLDRFPLFFPERRQFFQQDAAYFRFGGINYSPWPLFTRRIGLDQTGEPIPIRGGLRLTGREGPWTLGALAVAIGAADDVPAKEVGVVRVARQLDSHSTVGAIATFGEPRAAGNNRMTGLDYAYVNNVSHFGVMEARLWGMHTDSDLRQARDAAFGWQLRLPNEPWSLYQYIGQIGADFDPGLGFVQRRGIREYIHTATYRIQADSRRLRSADIVVNPYVVTDLDNRLESLVVDLPRVTFRNPAGDELSLRITRIEERLAQRFDLIPGLSVDAGNYGWYQGLVVMSTTIARPLSASVSVRTGEYFDGRRTDYGAQLTWRPRAGLVFTTNLEQRDLSLAQASAVVRLATLSARLNLSPRLSLSATGQYDNVSEELGVNVRLRWTVGLDNDFYLVFNHTRAMDNDDDRLLAHSVLAKFQWAFQF